MPIKLKLILNYEKFSKMPVIVEFIMYHQLYFLHSILFNIFIFPFFA